MDRDKKELIERIKRGAGFDLDLHALRALRSTLTVLGRHLDRDTARAVADALPTSYGAWLTRPGFGGCRMSLDQLYREVAWREGVSIGFAMEHSQVVIAVLLNWLDAATGRRLLRGLPEQLAELLGDTGN